jgi:hypothetical protein
VRLDRALVADIGVGLRSPAILTFLALEVIAGVVFVDRRRGDTITTVLLIYLGMLILAFFAWWAGRHRLAHPRPDRVSSAGHRSVFAVVAATGMAVWGFGLSVPLGLVLFSLGLGGWVWTALRSEGSASLRVRLLRDPRPFVPLLLLIALPRLLVGGLAFVVGAVAALPSGIGQQMFLLLGLFGPLEAWSGRPAWAAVISGLIFAALHVPLNMIPNEGDVLAAIANAVLFQASVGLVACLAYARHRAVVPIGVAHAITIG